MSMDVKQSDSCSKLQGAGKAEPWAFLDPLLKIDPILTHDVIHKKSNGNVFHVVGQRFADAVVHVDLPIGSGASAQILRCVLIYCAYLSPFWKSTTDVGTKNPWQHAVAPIPVTSRCGRLELACSMALQVLHVLACIADHQMQGHIERRVFTYLNHLRSTLKVRLVQIWIRHKCHSR